MMCGVASALESGFVLERVITDTGRIGIFDEVEEIFDDETIALEVANSLGLSAPVVYGTIIQAMMSEESAAFESAVFVALLAFEIGDGALGDLQNEHVRYICDKAQSVSKEAHKYKGLVRFGETMDGLMLARITPRYAVLPLLASHFKLRFSTHSWVIIDEIRQSAIYYDGVKVHYGEASFDGEPVFSDEEEQFRALWRRFFASIAIESRKNKKLQRQHIPKKFLKYLIEDILD
jgi:probable DNA metabolism protein